MEDGSVFGVGREEGDDLGFKGQPGGEGDDACEGRGVCEAGQVGDGAALRGVEVIEEGVG